MKSNVKDENSDIIFVDISTNMQQCIYATIVCFKNHISTCPFGYIFHSA